MSFDLSTPALLLLRGQDLLLIIGIFLLIFGGKKLPEFAKGLGESIRNFKTSMKDESGAAQTPVEEKKQA